VHLAKNLAKQCVVRRRVGQRCPISARDVTALHRVLPNRAHLFRSFCPVELTDRNSVAPIERFMQQLSAIVTLRGDQYRARVQIMLGRCRRFVAADLR